MKACIGILTIFLASCELEETVLDAGSKDVDAGSLDVDAGAEGCTCVALGADYASGVGLASVVHLPGMDVETDVIPGGVSSDPVARVLGGRVFIVNRFGADNITVVDRYDWTVLEQFSTGSGSNPQDIAVVGDTAYVVTLESSQLQIWDLNDTAEMAASVDLSEYDEDGVPNAASIAVSADETTAMVTLELLDETYVPRGNGKVVALDISGAEPTVLEAAELDYANPFGFMYPSSSGFLVATVPAFSAESGCLEVIDSGDGVAASCLVDNSALGGYVSSIAVGVEDVYLAISASYTEGKVIALDGDLAVTQLSLVGEYPTDVAFCAATNQLIYNDQNAGGLHVYDLAAGEEVTSEPLDIGLPPVFANAIACF